MNQLPIQRLPLSLIHFDDHTFRLLPFDEEPDERLSAQVQRCGILHPPLVKESGQGHFLIVAGHKRLQLARQTLGYANCDCLVLPEDFDPLATLALALDEALAQGQPSPMLRASFLKKVLPLCPVDEVARRFLPLLDLPPHPFHIKPLLGLANLEHPLALALHHGELDDKTALTLSGLSFRDRFALFDLITTLRLSVSNQRKLTALGQDLAKRQGTSIHAILAQEEIKAIIDQPEGNPPQKAALIMRRLGELHSPRLSTAERDFAALVSRLDLPKGAKLSHSPAFEKDEVTLTLTFADQSALVQAWPALAPILQN